MKMKRVAILATTGAVLISAGLLVPQVAFADEDVTVHDNFIVKLADRFNLSEDEIEEVFTEVREENQAERQAEREATIASALESGDLTERQADILDVMQENRPERGERPTERPQEGERKTAMLELLNDAGLDVSEDELEELHEAMQELGLGRKGEGRGKGMGMGMGRRNI